MRTFRSLYSEIAAPENIRAAFREALRGKRRRPAAASFMLDEEEELAAIERALAARAWIPAGYRTLMIREPKKRLIAVAPFRDRVVHHAIHRVLAPILTRRFIDTSYACMPGRGTHRAVLRFQRGLVRFPWIARLDIRRYYLEIDWDLLLEIIARTIRDAEVIELLERLLASGAGLYAIPERLDALGLTGAYLPRARKGLPIGNLTSQLFANLYLDGLDHHAKRVLKAPEYLRYLDDIVIFGRSKAEARDIRAACAEWLGRERRLAVHEEHGLAVKTRRSFRFLGCSISRTQRMVSGRTVRRLAARLRDLARAGAAEDELDALEIETAATIRSLVV